MNRKYRLLAIPLVLMMVVSGLVLVNEGSDESDAISSASVPVTVTNLCDKHAYSNGYVSVGFQTGSAYTYQVRTTNINDNFAWGYVDARENVNSDPTATSFPSGAEGAYNNPITLSARTIYESNTEYYYYNAATPITIQSVTAGGVTWSANPSSFTMSSSAGTEQQVTISRGGESHTYKFVSVNATNLGSVGLPISKIVDAYKQWNNLTANSFVQPFTINLTGGLNSHYPMFATGLTQTINHYGAVIIYVDIQYTAHSRDISVNPQNGTVTMNGTSYSWDNVYLVWGDQNGTTDTYSFNIVMNKYTVSFASNNSNYGTVSLNSIEVIPGSKIWYSGNSIKIGYGTPEQVSTITATPNPATASHTYSFDSWSNNVQTTPTPIQGNMTVTANFTSADRSYTVSIVSNNISWGTVSTPSVTVPYGTSISTSGTTLTVGTNTITATPHAQDSSYNYYFDYWYNASGTVTGDREIKAYFGRELTNAIQLFVGQTWTYTPTTSIPSATFSISGTATSWLSLSGGTISGTAPSVDEITYYHLVITAQTTNPTQTETQSMDFAVIPFMTASVSPNILYLWAGGPIPSSLAETITFSYDGYGTGSYIWSIVDAHNTGVQITSDGTIYGTAGAITDSPVSITARLTGNVNGIVQTEDVTFSVVIVAKLVFTSDPLTDAVIS